MILSTFHLRHNTTLLLVFPLLFASKSSGFAPLTVSNIRIPTQLYVNAATSFLKDDLESKRSPSAKKLSRPERKALERANKRANANHRKHNYADRSEMLQGMTVEGQYPKTRPPKRLSRPSNALKTSTMSMTFGQSNNSCSKRLPSRSHTDILDHYYRDLQSLRCT
jgi:hypothetical protein